MIKNLKKNYEKAKKHFKIKKLKYFCVTITTNTSKESNKSYLAPLRSIDDILIFDDRTDVWKTGSSRVVQVPPFTGMSHSYLRINSLSEAIYNVLKSNKAFSNQIQVYNMLVKFISNEKSKTVTDLDDTSVRDIFMPRVTQFIM